MQGFEFSILTLQEVFLNIQTNPSDPRNQAIANACSARSFSLIDTESTDSMYLLIGWNRTVDNIFIYETRVLKNLWFVYPHTILMDDDHVKNNCAAIINKLLEIILLQYQDDKLIKAFDFKVVIYIPLNITITNGYKSGPCVSNILKQSLPKSTTQWYEYVVKINQLIWEQKTPHRHRKKAAVRQPQPQSNAM